MSAKIFISYASKDRVVAEAICAALESHALTCWMAPRDILPGTEWPNAIVQAISTCSLFVLVFSAHSNGSTQTRKEVDCAINYEKTILPFRIENIQPAGSMAYYLGDLHWLDALTPPIEEHINRLVDFSAKILEPALVRFPDDEQALPPDISMRQVASRLGNPLINSLASWLHRLGIAAPGSDAVSKRNRLAMLDLVDNIWVKGLLDRTVDPANVIEIDLETRNHAIEQPWTEQAALAAGLDFSIPSGTGISELFQKSSRSLLLLGKPGSGKTCLMLELLKEYLVIARKDSSAPIPVIFNLSSWSGQKRSLAEWLTSELNNKYHVPQRVARQWIETDQLLLLLDGLDEGKTPDRVESVRAINSFLREHGLSPILVTSRLAEYESLPVRLELQNAILIKPLSNEKIDRYLAQSGSVDSSFTRLLDEDPGLKELARTPLFLALLSKSRSDFGAQASREAGSSEERKRAVLSAFVDTLLSRRNAASVGKQYKPLGWLAWLAGQMNRHAQSILLIEQLQPDWLVQKLPTWGYILATRLVGTFVLGFLPICLIPWIVGNGVLEFQAFLLLIVFGFTVFLFEVFRLNWNKNPFGSKKVWLRVISIIGYIIVLLFGLGLSARLIFAIFPHYTNDRIILPIIAIAFLFGLKASSRDLKNDIHTFEGLQLRPRKFVIPIAIGAFLAIVNLSFSGIMHNWLVKTYGSFPAAQIVSLDGKSKLDLSPGKAIESFAYSPDGAHMVVLNRDGSAELWDHNGILIASLPDKVVSAFFLRDNSGLVLLRPDRTVQLLDLRGVVKAAFPGLADVVYPAPSGDRLLGLHYSGIQRASTTKGPMLFLGRPLSPIHLWDIHGNLIADLTSSDGAWGFLDGPSGWHAVTLEIKNSLDLWNENGDHFLSLENLKTDTLTTNADFTQIAAVMTDGSARIWDGDGHLQVIFKSDIPFTLIKILVSGKLYLTQASLPSQGSAFPPSGGRFQIWNMDGTQVGEILLPAFSIDDVFAAPDGSRIDIQYSLFKPVYHHQVGIWDDQGNPVVTLGDSSFLGFAQGPENSTLLVTFDKAHNRYQVWDQSGSLISTIHSNYTFEDFFNTPGFKRLVTVELLLPSSWKTLGNSRYRFTLWDTLKGTSLTSQQGLVGNTYSVGFSPDGTQSMALFDPPQDFHQLLVLWLFSAVLVGFLFSLHIRVVEKNISPNQGIHRSLVNALLIGLISEIIGAALFLAIVGIAISLINYPVLQSLIQFLPSGLLWTSIFSLSMFLAYGGQDVLNHYVLRLLLMPVSHTPWRVSRLLDSFSDQGLTQKVGGGYIFFHRLVQDYFASLPAADYSSPGSSQLRTKS